jgi:hypothetical protein
MAPPGAGGLRFFGAAPLDARLRLPSSSIEQPVTAGSLLRLSVLSLCKEDGAIRAALCGAALMCTHIPARPTPIACTWFPKTLRCPLAERKDAERPLCSQSSSGRPLGVRWRACQAPREAHERAASNRRACGQRGRKARAVPAGCDFRGGERHCPRTASSPNNAAVSIASRREPRSSCGRER